MPAFYAIAMAFGVLTTGVTAPDAKHWSGADRSPTSTTLSTFYGTKFTRHADRREGGRFGRGADAGLQDGRVRPILLIAENA